MGRNKDKKKIEFIRRNGKPTMKTKEQIEATLKMYEAMSKTVYQIEFKKSVG